MQIEITLQGGEVKKCNLPENWQDLTFGQYFEIAKITAREYRHSELVAICLGLNHDFLLQLPKKQYDLFADRFGWLSIAPKVETPKSILFGGEVYDLPNDIGMESIGQYQDLVVQLARVGEDANKVLEFYPKIVATYLQPKVCGTDYDFSKVAKIEKQLFDANAMDIIGFANFFLQTINESSRGIAKNINRYPMSLKKVWQVLKNWVKSTVSYSHSKT